MVTHGNMLQNLACLRNELEFLGGIGRRDLASALHDMGLIGGLLQPLYAGGE
jgi:hypothetical protein